MGNQWWGKFYGIWVVAIPVVCFGLTYPIASFAEGNERHLMWPNLYVPSATLAHSGGAPYYIGLVGLFLFSSVVILLVLKHHEQIGLLAGDRYHEIQTRTRLTLAVGLLAAFCVLLVGVFDLSRFFFIHTNVAMGGFFGMVLFCLLSHLLFKQDVLAPYNKPKARYWRKVLIWIAGISCLLMPMAHGSYAIREKDVTKLIRERVLPSDTFGYFISILFLVSELTTIISGIIMVGIVLPRSLSIDPISRKREYLTV